MAASREARRHRISVPGTGHKRLVATPDSPFASSELYTGDARSPQGSTQDRKNFPHTACGIRNCWSGQNSIEDKLLCPQGFPQLVHTTRGVSPDLSTELSTGRVGCECAEPYRESSASRNDRTSRLRGPRPTLMRAAQRQCVSHAAVTPESSPPAPLSPHREGMSTCRSLT